MGGNPRSDDAECFFNGSQTMLNIKNMFYAAL